jgi:hypothetical protein
LEIARTAIDDAQALDAANYRLHNALRSLLQAYLPPRTAKEWRMLCQQFVWPSVFARGWTDAVRLYELGSAIAALTAGDALYVKGLDVPSWAGFLQILEDAGPAWMVAVLNAQLRRI